MNLVLLETLTPTAVGKPRGRCLCECGAEFTTQIGNVRSGNTQSCGCLRRARMTRHGLAGSGLYKAWENMRQRTRPDSPIYPTYAGVSCDPQWATFEGFLANPPAGLENGEPTTYGPGMCLARFNDSGDYTPENTRWLSRSDNSKEQARLKRGRK